MIIDTSAVIAILFKEPGHETFLEELLGAARPRMSVADWLEAALVIDGTKRIDLAYRFDQFSETFGVELVAVDQDQIAWARIAGANFGRGHHPARLNYGDCFACALSKATGEALLFKGDDFPRTDIVSALPR